MKHMKKTKVALAVIGALAMLDVGMSQALAAAEVEIQEMVVTAQKREQKLSEVPLAVQAFSSDALEKAHITDLNELISSIPGASEGRSTTAGSRSYQIRGVASYYGDSTVGYYLDDTVFTILNRNWAPIARTFDVERVEVLRGPQGTLYGLGAMGGSVKFITADPDLKRFRARGDVSYSATKGGDPNWAGNMAVSIPLSEDVLAIRAVASYDHKGGFAESPSFPGEKNITEAQNYRLKALAKPTKELTVRAGYSHTDERDDKGNQLEYVPTLVGGVPVNTFNNNFAPSTLNNVPVSTFNNTKMNVSSLNVAYDFGPVTLESSTGYLEANAQNRVPVNGVMLNTTLNATTASSELRLVSNGKGPLKWIGGVMYLHAESAEDVNLQAYSPSAVFYGFGPSGLYPAIRNDRPEYQSKSWSEFGEVSYDFLDGRLTPTIGIRHFKDDRVFTDVQRRHTALFAFGPPFAPPPPFGPPPTVVVPASTTVTSATFESWNPRFNLSYKVTKDDMVYGNIAKGFRSGVFNSAGTVASVPGTPSAVQPDKLWSYEVGTKLNFLDRKLALGLAVYHLDWSDIQLNFNAPGLPPPQPQVIANAGKAKGDGLDYDVNWVTPVKGLTVAATGNFNRTKFTSIDNPVAFAGTNIQSGEQLRSVPKQTHSLSATFKHPLTSDLTMTYFGSFTYIGEQGDLSTVTYVGPARTQLILPAPLGEAQKLVKLRVGVEGENWGAHLFGENLTNQDKPYYFNGSGWQRPYPRTIGLEVNFDY